jgi:hypothetical protein
VPRGRSFRGPLPPDRISMLTAERFHSATLDVATLCFVGLCLAGLLGVFMVFAWFKERDMRALAW